MTEIGAGVSASWGSAVGTFLVWDTTDYVTVECADFHIYTFPYSCSLARCSRIPRLPGAAGASQLIALACK